MATTTISMGNEESAHAGRFSQLFKSGRRSDIVLIVGKSKDCINAHKFILMTGSPVFEIIFNDDPTMTELKIPEVKPAPFRLFLMFLYTGKLSASELQKNSIALLNVANVYKVPDLTEMCKNIFEKTLRKETAIGILKEAVEYGNNEYVKYAVEVICKYGYELVDSPEFLNLSEECLAEIVVCDDLAVHDEMQLFKALYRWAEERFRGEGAVFTPTYCRSVLDKLIPHIRFPQMELKEFSLNVGTLNILTLDEILSIWNYFAIPISTRSEAPPGIFNPRRRNYQMRTSIGEDFCESGIDSVSTVSITPSSSDVKSTEQRGSSHRNKNRQESKKPIHHAPAVTGVELSDVNKLDQEQASTYFGGMGLNKSLLKGINAYGLEKPSAVQKSIIISCIRGGDVIVNASSGSVGNKTALSIAILQKIKPEHGRQCQALILTQTHELAQQLQIIVNTLAIDMDITCNACFGRTNMFAMCLCWEKQTLVSGTQIIIGTPACVFNMVSRGTLQIELIKTILILEADERLPNEYRDINYNDLKATKGDTQVILVSATMPIWSFTRQFMRKPVIISGVQNLSFNHIKQFYINVEVEEHKMKVLLDLYDTFSFIQAIIFCNTWRSVNWVVKIMKEKGHIVSGINLGMDQVQREMNMNDFRIIITTQPFPHKTGVEPVSVVINYDLPTSRENYRKHMAHRESFRESFPVINFVTNETQRTMDIAEFYNTQIVEMPSYWSVFYESLSSTLYPIIFPALVKK